VPEIEFLGHIVSAAGIKLSDSKRAGLVSIPVPVDRASLQAFIGLTNYFRDFVSHCATRACHHSKLLSPKVPFLWMDVHTKEFNDIKDAISNAPLLHHINYDLSLIVRSDASQLGIGAVLLQITNTGVEQYVAFASMKFSEVASRWATPDKKRYLHLCLPFVVGNIICVVINLS